MALVFASLLTGCHTFIQAPGATGKVIDADTGEPVQDARVTRAFIVGGLGGTFGVPAEGLPAATVLSDKNGNFNLAPATKTEIVVMYLRNRKSIAGTFAVSAVGYATNQLSGAASSTSRWRVQLGEVHLKRE